MDYLMRLKNYNCGVYFRRWIWKRVQEGLDCVASRKTGTKSAWFPLASLALNRAWLTAQVAHDVCWAESTAPRRRGARLLQRLQETPGSWNDSKRRPAPATTPRRDARLLQRLREETPGSCSDAHCLPPPCCGPGLLVRQWSLQIKINSYKSCLFKVLSGQEQGQGCK